MGRAILYQKETDPKAIFRHLASFTFSPTPQIEPTHTHSSLMEQCGFGSFPYLKFAQYMPKKPGTTLCFGELRSD